MRIYYANSSKDLTISEAIEAVLDGEDYDRDKLETAQATANNAASMMGELLEILHNKKVLSDSDIGGLINSSCNISWES